MSRADVIAFIGALVIVAGTAVVVFAGRTRRHEPDRDVESFPAEIRAQVPEARRYSRMWSLYHHSRKGGRDA